MNPDTKLKETLHISRHWDNPQVRVAVHREGIAIDASLEDFVRGLAAEVGSPTWIIKAATLEQKMVDAITPVLHKIQESSAHI